MPIDWSKFCDEKITEKSYVCRCADAIHAAVKESNTPLCWCNEMPFVFIGTHWAKFPLSELLIFLRHVSIKAGVPYDTARYHLFTDKLQKQFCCELTRIEQSENAGIFINLQNGTLSFDEHGEHFKPHDAKEFIQYVLPFSYEPNATAPMFQKYLNRCVPDKNCQMILAEYLGYVFARNLKLEKVLILFGNGANGKSVFADIATALIGETNCTHFSLSELGEKNDNNRFAIHAKLLNFGTELGNRNIDFDLLKKLASHEPITCGACRNW